MPAATGGVLAATLPTLEGLASRTTNGALRAKSAEVTEAQSAAGWGRVRPQEELSTRQKAEEFASMVRLWKLFNPIPNPNPRPHPHPQPHAHPSPYNVHTKTSLTLTRTLTPTPTLTHLSPPTLTPTLTHTHTLTFTLHPHPHPHPGAAVGALQA